jgi:hypothetical protein
MKIAFTESGWADYLWFQEYDRRLLKRINSLIKDARRSPFEGIGKPEPLKGDLSGPLVTTNNGRAPLNLHRHSQRADRHCLQISL